jgi:putative transposase
MSDTSARVLVHVVWAVHDREPTLAQSRDPLLHDRLRAEAPKLRSMLLAVGNADDHVHALVDLHRTVTLAALVQQIKGASAHAWNIERHEPWLRWQSGYWAQSVCAEHLDAVVSYVRAQRLHHPAFEPWQRREASGEPPKGA